MRSLFALPTACRSALWSRSIPPCVRQSSTFTRWDDFLTRPFAQDIDKIRKDLLSRPLNTTYDYLYPTPSHLLSVSLKEFLPFSTPASAPLLSFDPLPQGHHLVYFNPQLPASALIADGTDTLQYPGIPFDHRLWAGGNVKFSPSRAHALKLDGKRALCVEGIRAVTRRSDSKRLHYEDSKTFVHIERRYGYVPQFTAGSEEEAHKSAVASLWPSDPEDPGSAAIIERRDLVFLWQNVAEKLRQQPDPDYDSSHIHHDSVWEGIRDIFRRHVKVPPRITPMPKPDYSETLTPDVNLLFRFSALTFNAHRIHFSRQYAKVFDGFRDVIVHGPLSLAIMLQVLASQLGEGKMVESLEYKNLQPLHVNEEMRVCMKRNDQDGKRWTVWITGEKGVLAVRGRARVCDIR